MKRLIVGCAALGVLTGCSGPSKPQVPSLTPDTANQLLHYEPKAEAWLIHVRRQDPSCAYVLDIPDQTNSPTELDLTHIVKCGPRPAPIDLDASVSFQWDKNAQHWTVKRFSD